MGYKPAYDICTVYLTLVVLPLGIDISQSGFHRNLDEESGIFFVKDQVVNI